MSTDYQITREDIKRYFEDDGLSQAQIGRILGVPGYKVGEAIASFGAVRTKRPDGLKIGDKYHYVEIVGFSQGLIGRPTCKCVCGKEFVSRATSLRQGSVWSCGCMYRTLQRNRFWQGYGEISGTYWSRVEKNARGRELAFTIAIEQAWELFLIQDRRCALSGVPLQFPTGHRSYQRKEQTASLDRIDSKQGYVEGNVQWVHKAVNEMKWAKSDKEFVEWCVQITEYQNELANAA